MFNLFFVGAAHLLFIPITRAGASNWFWYGEAVDRVVVAVKTHFDRFNHRQY